MDNSESTSLKQIPIQTFGIMQNRATFQWTSSKPCSLNVNHPALSICTFGLLLYPSETSLN